MVREVAEMKRKAMYNVLLKKYPELYGKMEYYNFDLPVGWFEVIKSFSEKAKGFTVIGIKEKYGQLRVTVHLSDNAVEVINLINITEKMASLTCQFCGSCEEVELIPIKNGFTACKDCKIKESRKVVWDWIYSGNKFMDTEEEVARRILIEHSKT